MKLNYKEFGQGRPLIILHGFLGSLDNWQTLARRFAEHFRVFTIDQRNHGQSQHDDEMNYDALSSDLLEFIADHGIGKTSIIGHSMGGKTAMKFTIDHPALVISLVVADICPRKYSNRHAHILEALSEVDFEKMRGRKEVEDFLMSRINERSTVAFLSKNIYWKEENKLAFRFNLSSLLKNIETINDWPVTKGKYEGPGLFIRAGKAEYIRDEEPSIAEFFPAARIATIDSGHWIHAEKPDEFFGEVFNFIN